MIYRSAIALGAALLLSAPQPALAARPIGSDAAACGAGGGPALQVNVTGLKDRKGRLKVELWPANEEDFLKNDTDLATQGKFFRRVWADMPASGAVEICVKVPKAGKYAMFFTHDRDGKNKFNFWQDGLGVPYSTRVGRARPKLATAVVEVGSTVTPINIQTQYLRGLGGFGVLKSTN